MSCYQRLREILCGGKNTLYHDKIDRLEKNGELKPMLENVNIKGLLKYDFYEFITYMEEMEYSNRAFKIHILAQESEFVKDFNEFGYPLSIYLGNLDAYRVFPLFFMECARFYGNEKYSNLPYEELEIKILKCLDLKKYFDVETKKELTEVVTKPIQKYVNYSDYESDEVNISSRNSFFIVAERETYDIEYNNFKVLDYNLSQARCGLINYDDSKVNDHVIWVSKCHGDGYGFDVLSYDLKENREKLIEVKTGSSGILELSKNEYKMALKTCEMPYCDYYINWYNYDRIDDVIKICSLMFDKTRKIFIDQEGTEYALMPYLGYPDDCTGNSKYGIVKVSVVPMSVYENISNEPVNPYSLPKTLMKK